MANTARDLVRETANAPGTGTLTLGGAPTGYRSFSSAVGVGNSCYFIIRDSTQWEVCDGTLTASTTLTRDTVIRNSAGTTAKINFTGAVDVYHGATAEKSVQLAVGVTGPVFVTQAGANWAAAADLPAQRTILYADATLYLAVSGGNPVLNFDANDFLSYDRTNNRLSMTIGGTERFAVGTSGPIAKTIAKAWVNFNGTGVVSIRDSFNVSSITDNGTGDYTINFTSAMADTSYGFGLGVETAVGSVNSTFLMRHSGSAYSTTSFRLSCVALNLPSVVVTDPVSASAVFFGA
ncbi:MAG: hypothetical protein IM628_06960 [Phenylobacterium sp.]|uniref:hypothetical protein n=1 Tax=Phenylobacterium sp. TaxID=1871053 RepID=UPI0025CEE1A9|nr:hypothetical protein [Phenylobacterium sp.]MCA6304543.1 hypothetical protein [Phenylobacterium sp.]